MIFIDFYLTASNKCYSKSTRTQKSTKTIKMIHGTEITAWIRYAIVFKKSNILDALSKKYICSSNLTQRNWSQYITVRWNLNQLEHWLLSNVAPSFGELLAVNCQKKLSKGLIMNALYQYFDFIRKSGNLSYRRFCLVSC